MNFLTHNISFGLFMYGAIQVKEITLPAGLFLVLQKCCSVLGVQLIWGCSTFHLIFRWNIWVPVCLWFAFGLHSSKYNILNWSSNPLYNDWYEMCSSQLWTGSCVSWRGVSSSKGSWSRSWRRVNATSWLCSLCSRSTSKACSMSSTTWAPSPRGSCFVQ